MKGTDASDARDGGIGGGAKAARLDDLLADRGLEAVWFGRPETFAWLTGGDNVVDRAAEVGVAAAGYDGNEVAVVTDNIEADRLRDEQLGDVRVETYPWHEASLAEAVRRQSPEPAGADFDVRGFERVDGSQVRQPLTPGDVDRYRVLGEATARAVEAACRGAEPDATERAVAADLRGRLAERGIDAPVALVGGADRAGQYRHYTPTGETLGGYALVSVTARRDGLYASCTRTVAFDPPAWLEERHRAAARVEATALAATLAYGRRDDAAGDVFEKVRTAYASLGYRGEWRNHHQGGAAGYAGREWIASPDSTETVELPMAYAWNPTVRGAKSEDTVLVTDDGFETLTPTDGWPTAEFDAIGFDARLERPAVLER